MIPRYARYKTKIYTYERIKNILGTSRASAGIYMRFYLRAHNESRDLEK